MGQRLDQLIEAVREEKGPFFMARLCLRLDFDLAPGVAQDSEEREQRLIEACRLLGYEVSPEKRKRPASR